jgi:hypothetical protein
MEFIVLALGVLTAIYADRINVCAAFSTEMRSSFKTGATFRAIHVLHFQSPLDMLLSFEPTAVRRLFFF